MANSFGQYGRNRPYEMLPGILAWMTIIGCLLGAFFAPLYAIIFILVFDVYWTLRVFYFMIHVFSSYRMYKQTVRVDWYERVREIRGYDEIYHVVMLPTYKEGVEILKNSLDSLIRGAYDASKFIVVVGGEEKDSRNFANYSKEIRERYEGIFGHLMFTVHPADLPGEIPGKGSNLKWMAEKVRGYIDDKRISYDKIIVSAFDVDTVAHDQYFARLTYLFLTVENPLRSSYQPLTLFSNNIWYANPVVRTVSFGTVFWLLGELVRHERMWTFSSHSMPWQMLVDVGYHEPDLVSEDSRIFLQGFLHYDGHYRVTPMYLPVHMDAVEADGFWASLKALYKQQRRWAWGVEHLPYMIDEFKKHPDIPRGKKFALIFNHIEGMYTWATAPLVIFFLGYLPFWVTKNSTIALVANSPFTLERIMQIATIGVFFTGFMSFFFLPRRPEKISKSSWLIMIVQWAMLPITFTLFGALPALDAQTRFLFGRYLGFNVTEKKR
jgi:hypothetical protein